jgi:hypothetical protein
MTNQEKINHLVRQAVTMCIDSRVDLDLALTVYAPTDTWEWLFINTLCCFKKEYKLTRSDYRALLQTMPIYRIA